MASFVAGILVWLGRLVDAESQRQQLGNEFLPSERVELDGLAFHRGHPAVALNPLHWWSQSFTAAWWEIAFHALNTEQKWAAQTLLRRARSLFPDSARLIGEL